MFWDIIESRIELCPVKIVSRRASFKPWEETTGGSEKEKKTRPMCSGNSLIWILSIGCFSYNRNTMAMPLLYLLLLQKLECHIRPSMLGMIKKSPQVFGSSFGLKTPFEENICGRSQGRGHGAKVSAAMLDCHWISGAAVSRGRWAPLGILEDGFQSPALQLPLL